SARGTVRAGASPDIRPGVERAGRDHSCYSKTRQGCPVSVTRETHRYGALIVRQCRTVPGRAGYSRRFLPSVQLVLVQFLGVRGVGDARPLRRDRSTFCVQRKMHTVKRAKHRNGVVAPQSSMTPNNLLRHTYYPAGHMGIATVDKLPATPVFISS